VLCSYVPGCSDAGSLRLAGAPPRALALEPLDERAQPCDIPEVRTWASAGLACLSHHNVSLPTVLVRPAHASRVAGTPRWPRAGVPPSTSDLRPD